MKLPSYIGTGPSPSITTVGICSRWQPPGTFLVASNFSSADVKITQRSSNQKTAKTNGTNKKLVSAHRMNHHAEATLVTVDKPCHGILLLPE